MKPFDIKLLYLAFFATIAFAALSSQAYAQCTNPEGTEGQIFYNTTHKVVQFCNGVAWVNTGAFANNGLPTTCGSGDTITWNGTTWVCTSDGAPEPEPQPEPDPDTTPDAFSFTDVTDAALNTLITSNTITITDINAVTPVSVSGQGSPRISINGGSWVTSGTITNNQTLQVRLTSANAGATNRSATIDVGGVTDDWSVITLTSGGGCGACAGTCLGGYCWYLSTSGKSCDEACAPHGGCNLTGTPDYAGSAGTNANCQAVLDALGVTQGFTTCSDYTVGCSLAFGFMTGRCTGTTTCASAVSGMTRACACNN